MTTNKATEGYKQRLSELVRAALEKEGSYDKLALAIALKAGSSPSPELMRKWQVGKFVEEPGDEYLAQFAKLLGKDLKTLQAELRGKKNSAKKLTESDLVAIMRQESDLVAIAEAVAIGVQRLAQQYKPACSAKMGGSPLTTVATTRVNSQQTLTGAKSMATNRVTELIWEAMRSRGLDPDCYEDALAFLRNGAWSVSREILDRGLQIVAGTTAPTQEDAAAIAATLTRFTKQPCTQDDIYALLEQTETPTQLPEQGGNSENHNQNHNHEHST